MFWCNRRQTFPGRRGLMLYINLKTINLETIIFQCSRNYGTPTLVTRLKVAPNMADQGGVSLRSATSRTKGLLFAGSTDCSQITYRSWLCFTKASTGCELLVRPANSSQTCEHSWGVRRCYFRMSNGFTQLYFL